MDNSFPFFGLPILARAHIVGKMLMQEKYQFSTVSNKTNQLVKFATRKGSHHFSLTFSDIFEGKISILEPAVGERIHYNDDEDYSIFNCKITPDEPTEAGQESILDLDFVEFEVVSLIETFNFPTVSLTFKENCSLQLITKFILLIKQKNLKLGTMSYDSNEPNDDLYKFVIEQSRSAKHLTLLARTTPDFKCEVNMLQSLEASYLHIWNATWVTKEHLFDCFLNRKVVTFDCSFDTTVCNLFLKKWIEGSSLIGFTFKRNTTPLLETVFGDINVTLIGSNDGAFVEGGMIKQIGGKESVVFSIKTNDGLLFCLSTKLDLLVPVE